MRRKLACDGGEVGRHHGDDPARLAQLIEWWKAAGSRVVLVSDDAIDVLACVPLAESVPAAAGDTEFFYIAPSGSDGFGLCDPESPDEAPLDGVWVFSVPPGTDDPPGIGYAVAAFRGGSVHTWGPYRAASGRSSLSAHLERIIAATLAALADPLWLRKVIVCTDAQQGRKSRRARKRGDPRANPLSVLRLAPTKAPHVVRYLKPVVISPAGPTAQPPRRRAGRGIVVGPLLAEHDVRAHVRRIVTTWGRAAEMGWDIAKVLGTDAPESESPDAFPVLAMVPVRPHTRGKGPRRDVLVRGPKR